MKIEQTYIGGWFQRTTLHLSEIYDFIQGEESPLGFDNNKLAKLRQALFIKEAHLEQGDLEHIVYITAEGLVIDIFEDGLIVLHKKHGGVLADDIEELKGYYESKLSPALSYIFSLGAPIPKELANIKTIYPYFVVLKDAVERDIQKLLEEFKQHKHTEIKEKTFEMYRGDKLYVINDKGVTLDTVERFVQEQIFIREFKGQLHRYLNLHRIIWERIAEVKERGKIGGKEVGPFYAKIESYAKTINLIDARISQMGTYIHTRESIAKNDPHMKKMIGVLQYRYETLADTLSYIKDIWGMTKNYVDSALSVFSSIQAQSTEASVENLTVITSVGVGATLIGLFSESAPDFTIFGVAYFFILVAIGYMANKIMRYIAQRRKYEIEDVELAKDIE
ncbi:hypothetical protein L0Y40_03205 [Candidatus Wolfebacteria bacterium]|nr:hypothetical protein [Candidatus Wolfebacteria bacterium]